MKHPIELDNTHPERTVIGVSKSPSIANSCIRHTELDNFHIYACSRASDKRQNFLAYYASNDVWLF